MGEALTLDSLKNRSLSRLDDFLSWLKHFGVRGVLGEIGWPAGPAWEPAVRAVLDKALPVIPVYAWSAGPLWQPTYPLGILTGDGRYGQWPSITLAHAQGLLLSEYQEDSPNYYTLGLNVNGPEFGVGQLSDGTFFSNQNLGAYGSDYVYPSDNDYKSIVQMTGVRKIRLAVRWERLQQSLGGELNPFEVSRLRSTLYSAWRNRVQVALCVFSSGDYLIGDGKPNTEHPEYRNLQWHLTYPDTSHFSDLWIRLVHALKDREYVIDLVNEPRGHQAEPPLSGYQVWHAISVDAVKAIRAEKYRGTIFVPGSEFSGARKWGDFNGEPWIDDSHVRYEAHLYLDDDASGSYKLSAVEENDLAAQQGY